jgi:hypothetical protein
MACRGGERPSLTSARWNGTVQSAREAPSNAAQCFEAAPSVELERDSALQRVVHLILVNGWTRISECYWHQ